MDGTVGHLRGKVLMLFVWSAARRRWMLGPYSTPFMEIASPFVPL